MSNTLFVILVPIGMFTILAVILWGPTVFLLFRKRKRGVIVPLGRLSRVLFAELLVASVLVVIADLIGLRNPGGYVLATAVLVGVTGGAKRSNPPDSGEHVRITHEICSKAKRHAEKRAIVWRPPP